MAHSPTPTAAVAMRAIARRRPLPVHGHDFLCARCSVTWTGAERDCFFCGLPATSEHTHPGTGLQLLLCAVGRTAQLTPPARADQEMEEVR